MFEWDVDVVDWEGVRRDLTTESGYCCEAGEEDGGSLEPLRVFVGYEDVAAGCREDGKAISGTTLVNGRRSVRFGKSGAGGRGFLWGS